MHINTHSQQLCEAWNYFQSLLYNWKSKTKHTDQFQVPIVRFPDSTGNQIYAETHPRTLNRSLCALEMNIM